MRAFCAKKYCWEVKEKGDRLQADLCIHRCINQKCYEWIYWDLKPEPLSNFEYEAMHGDYIQQSIDADLRKKVFILCFQEVK